MSGRAELVTLISETFLPRLLREMIHSLSPPEEMKRSVTPSIGRIHLYVML